MAWRSLMNKRQTVGCDYIYFAQDLRIPNNVKSNKNLILFSIIILDPETVVWWKYWTSLGKDNDQNKRSVGGLLLMIHVGTRTLSLQVTSRTSWTHFKSLFYTLNDSASWLIKTQIYPFFVHWEKNKTEWAKIYCGDWLCIALSIWVNCVGAPPIAPQSMALRGVLFW